MNERTSRTIDALIDRYLDTAYQLARWSCRNPQHAEEAVYDATLIARQRFNPGAGRGERVWFLAIVREVVAGRHGLDRVTSPEDAWGLYSNCDVGGAPASMVGDEALTMEEAIRRLPYTLRQVLVLRDVEGLSYQELADIVGVTADTITACLSRARRRLSRAFGLDRSAPVEPEYRASEARVAACCGKG